VKKRTAIVTLPILALLASACGGTLQVTVERAATPASAPIAIARPTSAAPGITATPTEAPGPKAFALGDLVVEEYPVVSKDLDTPNHFEFNQRILPAVLERRKTWRGRIPERRADAANQALAHFGYRLQPKSDPPGPRYDLYQGDTVVQADISTVWPISVAASGSDFALLVEDERGRSLLVTRGTTQPWDAARHGFIAPVMVGLDLVSVEATANGQDWLVRRGGQVVYTVRNKPIGPANPLKGLWSWSGHWVLEVDGQVIVDGRSLNEELGYQEVFAWQLLNGQPFYFFKKGGRIGVSYAGQTLAPRYDEVIHYRCCEPAAFNVAGNGTMVWGYALRDGLWYYVEIGVYR